MQLNHVFKTRDIVTKNDKKSAKHKELSEHKEILDSENCRDQGFTRPKVNCSKILFDIIGFIVYKVLVNNNCNDFQVLILLPMASIAYRVVNRLILLTPTGNKVSVNLILTK